MWTTVGSGNSNQQLKGKKSSMKLENGKTVNMILIMYMLRGKAKNSILITQCIAK